MVTIHKKASFTPEKEKRVLDYVQFVALCAEMIKIEWQCEAIDWRFKNPVINNHARKIIESAEQISRSLSSISFNTDREEFAYNTSLQVHRLLKHFSQYPVEKLEELMDIIEKEQITM